MSTQFKNESVGLLACGSSGPWQIDIDESSSGENWWMQIEGPSVYFYFELPSLDIVGKIAEFLESKSGNTLVIGKSTTTPISLVKDDEYDDRFFLVIDSCDSMRVRFVIAGNDIVNYFESLKQVLEDLDV
jgi:hypothetical protein